MANNRVWMIERRYHNDGQWECIDWREDKYKADALAFHRGINNHSFEYRVVSYVREERDGSANRS